jgi:hypothetical protein
MGNLIANGCAATLSHVFATASSIFAREQGYMGQAIDAWNDILRARGSTNLAVRITFSNVGKYDSFVRSDAKIVVGERNGSPGLEQVVHAVKESDESEEVFDQSEESPYFAVKNRSTVSRIFEAKLPPETSERYHGAYLGGLSYLKVAFVVSAGQKETVVMSQLTPFSDAAKKQMNAKIIELKVPL